MASNKDDKISPKLIELCKWKNITEVNNMLDSGESPNKVCTYINKNGFKISVPMVYDYAKLRRKAIVDGLNIEHMIGVATKPLVSKAEKNSSSVTKLKSEIDALDKIIEGGYNTLLEWADRPINPKTMMDAISLKNKLTEGNHGFLTNYGMEQLRAIEKNKYELIMEHLISYIPEDKKQEAIDRIAIIEDEYYQGTDYYEEYLKALELPEDEFIKRLQQYEESKQSLEPAAENSETTDN